MQRAQWAKTETLGRMRLRMVRRRIGSREKCRFMANPHFGHFGTTKLSETPGTVIV